MEVEEGGGGGWLGVNLKHFAKNQNQPFSGSIVVLLLKTHEEFNYRLQQIKNFLWSPFSDVFRGSAKYEERTEQSLNDTYGYLGGETLQQTDC